MNTQLNLDSFIEEVQKLYGHVTGAIDLSICIDLIKLIQSDGYKLEILKLAPFVIGEQEFCIISNDMFNIFNRIDNIHVTIKLIKKEISNKIYHFVIVYRDFPIDKFAEVYMIDPIYNKH